MTIEALENAIIRLIKLRKKTDPMNDEELDRIKIKLDKLYDIKYIYYQQLAEKKEKEGKSNVST